VSGNDVDSPLSPHIPDSPPPSFRSRNSSPSSRHPTVDRNLADAFDADGSDDEDNDGDDRQRLMRGAPSSTAGPINTPASTRDSESPQPQIQRRTIQLPSFPTSTRVYGGGSGSDGVFANLSAKPEAGEKVEEHPPVRTSPSTRRLVLS
jgi:hypothetical protein